MDSDYELLGVPPNASQRELVRAWHRYCARHHPDVPGGDEERFRQGAEAFARLTQTPPPPPPPSTPVLDALWQEATTVAVSAAVDLGFRLVRFIRGRL